MEYVRHSHSLILKGSDRDSLYREARRLASALICSEGEPADRPCGACAGCRKIALNTYPYWFEIIPQGAANQIRISQIRDLQSMLISKAGEGQAKVAVLADAHRMREESQNCLLKTLEEPPPDTLLLLLTGKPHELLPTVRSRCQVIRIRDNEAAPDTTEQELVLDVLQAIRSQGYHGVFEKAAFVDGSRKKAVPVFLNAMEHVLRESMVRAMRGPEASRAPAGDFIGALEQVWRAGYLLERNVNALLVLENLFIQIKKLNLTTLREGV